LTPVTDLMDTAMEVANTVASNSQVAVQASKQVAYFWRNLAVREQLDFYRAVNQRLMLCEDVLEGPRAFAEKRDPVWVNRWPTPADPRPG
jgi:enoyl-CoA hydratase/carnithine racemase